VRTHTRWCIKSSQKVKIKRKEKKKGRRGEVFQKNPMTRLAGKFDKQYNFIYYKQNGTRRQKYEFFFFAFTSSRTIAKGGDKAERRI